MDHLIGNFHLILQGALTFKESIGEIAARSKKLITTSEKLSEILRGLDMQLMNLENYLNAFNGLSENAKCAFPVIEKNLDELMRGFAHSAEVGSAHETENKAR